MIYFVPDAGKYIGDLKISLEQILSYFRMCSLAPKMNSKFCEFSVVVEKDQLYLIFVSLVI